MEAAARRWRSNIAEPRADDRPAAARRMEQHAKGVTLLFSDVGFGGDLSGFGLARHVDSHWPHIEIVIASVHVLPEDGDMPDKATFIAKPFSERTVIEHLAEKLPDGKEPEPLKQAIS